jgi:hypothetical protein
MPRKRFVVDRGHLEGGARVPLPASRCARASFRLGQMDEVQAEASARMFRDGTYRRALCLCPAPSRTTEPPTPSTSCAAHNRRPSRTSRLPSASGSRHVVPKRGIIHSSGENRTALSSCAIFRARAVLPTPGSPTVKCSVGVSVIRASLTPSPIKGTHIGMQERALPSGVRIRNVVRDHEDDRSGCARLVRLPLPDGQRQPPTLVGLPHVPRRVPG